MKKNRFTNKWELCSFCKQIKLVSGSNHSCPDAVKIQREIEIEHEVEEALLLFDIAYSEFWMEPKTRFYKFLAERGDI